MSSNRKGETLFFETPVYIAGRSSIAGKREGQGPLSTWFDQLIPDGLWGEDSFEKCEKKLFTAAVKMAVEDAGQTIENTELLLGGDLLNQIISAGYSARDLRIPFLGLYGACSTMSEAMLLGAVAIDGGFAGNAVCGVSSHYGTSERQFRYPLELGTPKTPNSQNTVTGAAASFLSEKKKKTTDPLVTCATIGRVVDTGVTDADNMGAAMAPANVILGQQILFPAGAVDKPAQQNGDAQIAIKCRCVCQTPASGPKNRRCTMPAKPRAAFLWRTARRRLRHAAEQQNGVGVIDERAQLFGDGRHGERRLRGARRPRH